MKEKLEAIPEETEEQLLAEEKTTKEQPAVAVTPLPENPENRGEGGVIELDRDLMKNGEDNYFESLKADKRLTGINQPEWNDIKSGFLASAEENPKAQLAIVFLPEDAAKKLGQLRGEGEEGKPVKLTQDQFDQLKAGKYSFLDKLVEEKGKEAANNNATNYEKTLGTDPTIETTPPAQKNPNPDTTSSAKEEPQDPQSPAPEVNKGDKSINPVGETKKPKKIGKTLATAAAAIAATVLLAMFVGPFAAAIMGLLAVERLYKAGVDSGVISKKFFQKLLGTKETGPEEKTPTKEVTKDNLIAKEPVVTKDSLQKDDNPAVGAAENNFEASSRDKEASKVPEPSGPDNDQSTNNTTAPEANPDKNPQDPSQQEEKNNDQPKPTPSAGTNPKQETASTSANTEEAKDFSGRKIGDAVREVAKEKSGAKEGQSNITPEMRGELEEVFAKLRDNMKGFGNVKGGNKSPPIPGIVSGGNDGAGHS
ncbi:MAG: hypothetical protein ACJAW3_000721 [Lentimonas sp.]|jgi:hypothetical protein